MWRIDGEEVCVLTVTVNSDTPTIPDFFPLYYTKTLGGSVNGQKKVHNETGAGTAYSKLPAPNNRK